MPSLAIINQKGGVGKTTTAVNLAAALSRRGQRVLLVDIDPQAHATLHLGVDLGPDDRSIYDVLTGEATLADVARTVDERLTLVPAHIDLVGAELELAERPQRHAVLDQALASERGRFDRVLIDCGPSLGLLALNALAAADEVLIPLQPHFLALQGLGRLLETITLVRDAWRPGLRVRGVVLCMSESSTRLAQEVCSDVEQFLNAAPVGAPWHGATVLRTRIRRNIKLAEAPSFGKTIFQYAPGSHGAHDYAALAEELLEVPRAPQTPGTVGDAASPESSPAGPAADGPLTGAATLLGADDSPCPHPVSVS